MRVVPFFEKKQRGCQYCMHVTKCQNEFSSHDSRTGCPFDECPYSVLDKYRTYEEFMASEDARILVTEFFSTVASVYELGSAATSKKIFSDGDSRVNL